MPSLRPYRLTAAEEVKSPPFLDGGIGLMGPFRAWKYYISAPVPRQAWYQPEVRQRLRTSGTTSGSVLRLGAVLATWLIGWLLRVAGRSLSAAGLATCLRLATFFASFSRGRHAVVRPAQ